MEGGRFLGSGTYGCAFMPPLLCKGSTKKQYGKVGKITPDILAEQEILVAKKIRKVPLASNYFLLPEPESCTPAAEKLQSEPGLKECHDEFIKSEKDIDIQDLVQIVEPFGGTKPFYMYFDAISLHPKRFDFLRFMRHILEAGSTLLVAQVCHFDIHPGNLLVDKHNTVRILDFGLSFPVSSIDSKLLAGRWKRLRFGFEPDAAHPSIHNAEPPELTIMNALRRNEFDVPTAIKLTVFGKQIFKDMEKYLGVSMQQSYKELDQFWKTSEFAKQKDYVKLWKTYWPGFDSWSIASIIMDVLKIIMLLPEFTEGPYKTKKTAVLAALRGMLEPNPRERLDCIEALALFDPGNPWISRFGQKWLSIRKQQRKI